MATIPFDVDQAGWGSTQRYPDTDSFNPAYVVAHWGGGTSQIPAAGEDDRLRIWQRYHVQSRGMRDIAYNYAVGDSGLVYRCRGLNPGGHTKSSDLTPEGRPFNSASIGVVWVGGAADADGPSPRALAAMQRVCDAADLSVWTHKQAKQFNGSDTACPGPAWIQWVNDYEPGGDVQQFYERQLAQWTDDDLRTFHARGWWSGALEPGIVYYRGTPDPGDLENLVTEILANAARHAGTGNPGVPDGYTPQAVELLIRNAQ